MSRHLRKPPGEPLGGPLGPTPGELLWTVGVVAVLLAGAVAAAVAWI